MIASYGLRRLGILILGQDAGADDFSVSCLCEQKIDKKKQGIYVLVDRRISNLSVERQRRWAEFNGDGLWFLAFISFIGYRESVDGPKPDPLK